MSTITALFREIVLFFEARNYKVVLKKKKEPERLYVDITVFPLQATALFSDNRALFNGPVFARGVELFSYAGL